VTGFSTPTPAASTRPNVTSAELDTADFYPAGLVVGLQNYIDANSPLLSYIIPPQADYMQIIRCKNNTIIENGLQGMSLQSLSNSMLTQDQKMLIYQNNDYFGLALSNQDCVELSLATQTPEFQDSFAPSGSWFYLAHACVSPGRLNASHAVSNRNCSMQVAISTPLLNYVNTRDNALNSALQNVNVYSTKIVNISLQIDHTASQFATDLNNCALTAQSHAEAAKFRQGLAQVIGSGIELGLAVSAGAVGVIDLMFASSGFVFGPALKGLFTTSNDMARTCTTAMRDTNSIQGLVFELAQAKDQQLYWQTIVQNAKDGVQAISNSTFTVQNFQQQLSTLIQTEQSNGN